MKYNQLKILRCSTCHGKLQVYKKVNNSSVLSCRCRKYPCIRGIIYFLNNGQADKAVDYLMNYDEENALAALIQQRRLLFFPIKLLLLPTVIDTLLLKITKKHIHMLLGFNKVVKALTFFSYSKPWAWYVTRRQRMPSFLISYSFLDLIKRQDFRVLDFGCGPGHLLYELTGTVRPDRICAVDKSFLNLLFARIFFAGKDTLLICFDESGGDLPFIKGIFDMIMVTDAFHYINRKDGFLKECARILKVKGILSVIHTLNSNETQYGNIQGIYYLDLKKDLKRSGFTVHSIHAESSVWNSLKSGGSLRIAKSDAESRLKITDVYDFFASKTQLPTYLTLQQQTKDRLKDSPVEYKLDMNLLSLYNLNLLLKNYDNFIFVSPHLDDAVLSSLHLLGIILKHHKKVKVITVFTEVTEKPYSAQAKSFLREVGYQDARALFKDRVKEDLAVWNFLKVEHTNLNFVDAAWRKNNCYSQRLFLRPIMDLFPSLIHIYPDRESQFLGQVSFWDFRLIKALSEYLNALRTNDRTILIAPLGVGGHADHIIVREAVMESKAPALFWEDYPYNLRSSFKADFFTKEKRFRKKIIIENTDAFKKKRVIRLYKSQLSSLFPDNVIASLPEVYYSFRDKYFSQILS